MAEYWVEVLEDTKIMNGLVVKSFYCRQCLAQLQQQFQVPKPSLVMCTQCTVVRQVSLDLNFINLTLCDEALFQVNYFVPFLIMEFGIHYQK
jgi:hypothetical protein